MCERDWFCSLFVYYKKKKSSPYIQHKYNIRSRTLISTRIIMFRDCRVLKMYIIYNIGVGTMREERMLILCTIYLNPIEKYFYGRIYIYIYNECLIIIIYFEILMNE